MGLFRPYDPDAKNDASTSDPPATEEPGRPAGKGAPTPSRKQAESARRERINPVLTPKESRARERQARIKRQNRAVEDTEKRPERVLLRDHIDARWNFAEFLLPVMLVVLAVSFLASRWPSLVLYTTLATWGLLFGAIVDVTFMWQRYKKLLAQRYPGTSPKGLLMIAINRSMSIRRFRVPPPRIKRGATY